MLGLETFLRVTKQKSRFPLFQQVFSSALVSTGAPHYKNLAVIRCRSNATTGRVTSVLLRRTKLLEIAFSIRDFITRYGDQHSGLVLFQLDYALTALSTVYNKLSPRGRRDDMPPADGSSTRGGSTSVRGRVRSPHMAKLRAYSTGQLRAEDRDGQMDGSRYRLMLPPLRRGHNNLSEVV